MDLPTVITLLISLAALLLGLANYRNLRQDRRETNELQAESLLDEAFGALEDRRVEEARQLVRRASKLTGANARVLLYQGYLSEEDGDLGRAREYFQRTVGTECERQGYLQLGRISEGAEKVEFLRKAADSDPSRAAEPFYALALAHDELGDSEEALSCLRLALAANDKYAPALTEMGNRLFFGGRVREAIRHYESAIAADSGDCWAMVSLARALSDRDWETAQSWIEHAIHADPTSSAPYSMLAAIHADRDEPEQALANAERAVELEPKARLEGRVMADVIAAMRKRLRDRGSQPTAGSE